MDETPLYAFRGPTRILVFAKDYGAGAVQPWHRHDVPQLLHARRGLMRMATPGGYWVIPPGRGVWIPAFIPHEIHMRGPVSMCSLYVQSNSAPPSSIDCTVVEVSPLLQQLLHELGGLTEVRPADVPRRQAMEELTLLELTHLAPLRWQVPLPSQARLRNLCQAMLNSPADNRTIDEFAYNMGVSTRTLRRLFQRELGMSFGVWRQQARLMEACARLADGHSVSQVSEGLGYGATSAFTAMFSRSMGQSPRDYASSTPQQVAGDSTPWSRPGSFSERST
jgi:AraC-like DNA-binding protein